LNGLYKAVLARHRRLFSSKDQSGPVLAGFARGDRGRVLQFSVALLFPLIVGLVTYFVVGFFSRGARATRRRKAVSLEIVGGPQQQLHKLNGNFDRILLRWFRPVALLLIGASGSFIFVWYLLSGDAWSILSASAWKFASFR
jgi:hypothetical protein